MIKNVLIRFCSAPSLVVVFLGLSLGCTQEKPLPGPEETVRIGFSLDSLVVERWKRDLEYFQRAASDLGATVFTEIADQDPQVQVKQIQSLLDRGINVLVVVPNDAQMLSDVVKSARSRGIPVVSYDRLVLNANVDLYISFDNREVGKLMAESLTRRIPMGNYVIINGAKSDFNAKQVREGFYGTLTPLIQSGQIKLVKEIWPSTWDSDEIRGELEDFILEYPQIDGILAGNDMLAEAAIEVLTESRLASRVKVAGQDADLAACQRIAEGTQFSTVYKSVEELALKAAGFTMMLARGEVVETDSKISDGTYQVPFIRLTPVLVTMDNLDDTVIRGGYHSTQDVYRNIRR